MDFFAVSKLVWLIVQPAHLALLLLCCGVLLQLTRRGRRAGLAIVACIAGAFVLCTALPLGEWLLAPLEDRFAGDPSLVRLDGIVVLGGATNARISAARSRIALNDTAERLTAAVELARRFPAARILLTGGSGLLEGAAVSEAELMRRFIANQGIAPERVTIEDRSRNTAENAVFSFGAAHPQAEETWVLITSASHMPRAVGSFRRAGWTVVPYPVDYRTPGEPVPWFLLRLGDLGLAFHEWAGLVSYRLTGNTDELLPGPN